MKKRKETYVDGVETIHLLGGMVRMDMFSLQPPQEGNEPTTEVFERIIMPMQAFLNMHGAMQQVIDRMRQDGLVQDASQEKNNWDAQ